MTITKQYSELCSVNLCTDITERLLTRQFKKVSIKCPVFFTLIVAALFCSLLVGYFREYRLQNIAPAGLWDTDFKVTLFAVIPPRGQREKQGWRCKGRITKFRSTALHGWMGSLSTSALLDPAVVCWRTTTVLHMHSYHTESPSVCEDPSSHVHSKSSPVHAWQYTPTEIGACVDVVVLWVFTVYTVWEYTL